MLLYFVTRRTCTPFLSLMHTRSAFSRSWSVRYSRLLANACDKPTLPPQPGSVNTYRHHVFIRTAPSAAAAAGQGEIWWPPVVETQPALREAFAAVAKLKKYVDGVVKVTAYEEVGGLYSKLDACDLMIFPAGVSYRSLPIGRIQGVVETHVAEPLPESDYKPPKVDAEDLRRFADIAGIALFVCTHESRDCRCGVLGAPLARRLQTLLKERELSEAVRVFQCSHVGGHKFAGNVLVYGSRTPCDGDWFGGLTADDAHAFLEALLDAEVGGEGGAGEVRLRRWWRGRLGLTQQEQLALFERGQESALKGKSYEVLRDNGSEQSSGSESDSDSEEGLDGSSTSDSSDSDGSRT